MGDQKRFVEEAIQQSMMQDTGGPFGAVVVKDGQIVAAGHNSVVSTNDPTAHAEVVAIRKACEKLGTFQLTGCELYSSCEPCPMCMAAIYWARLDKVYYVCDERDAAKVGFDDRFIREEMIRPTGERSIKFVQLNEYKLQGQKAFEKWYHNPDNVMY